MHPNPSFRSVGTNANFAFARNRGFGVVAVNGPHGPVCSHIPFLLSEDGTCAEGHFVRSNPIVAMAGDAFLPAVLCVSGPDGYVSPDWYAVDDQVPTWNYVAVHLRGDLAVLGPEMLSEHLERLSHHFERRLLPKPEWLIDKVNADVLARLKRMVVPFCMRITEVDGTWKLNQNKDAAARNAAARSIDQSSIGQDLASLARLMKNPPG